MKRTIEVKEAIEQLTGLVPFDFAELSRKVRELEREKSQAWDRAVESAAEPYKTLKRYVRSRLKLGRGQSIVFHGNGVVAIYESKKLNRVACIDATIRTGVSGVEINLHWLPSGLADLDRKLAAVCDALAAIRME